MSEYRLFILKLLTLVGEKLLSSFESFSLKQVF